MLLAKPVCGAKCITCCRCTICGCCTLGMTYCCSDSVLFLIRLLLFVVAFDWASLRRVITTGRTSFGAALFSSSC
eukprot:UN09553